MTTRRGGGKMGKERRDIQRNTQQLVQSCCGANKPNHYGDCKTIKRR